MKQTQLPKINVLNKGLNKASEQIHKLAKDKGFWDSPREHGTLLMLVVSELSEGLEALRKNRRADMDFFKNNNATKESFQEKIKDTFEDEIADTIIRLLDMVGYMGIDIEKHINMKLGYNMTRGYKHGKSF